MITRRRSQGCRRKSRFKLIFVSARRAQTPNKRGLTRNHRRMKYDPDPRHAEHNQTSKRGHNNRTSNGVAHSTRKPSPNPRKTLECKDRSKGTAQNGNRRLPKKKNGEIIKKHFYNNKKSERKQKTDGSNGSAARGDKTSNPQNNRDARPRFQRRYTQVGGVIR